MSKHLIRNLHYLDRSHAVMLWHRLSKIRSDWVTSHTFKYKLAGVTTVVANNTMWVILYTQRPQKLQRPPM